MDKGSSFTLLRADTGAEIHTSQGFMTVYENVSPASMGVIAQGCDLRTKTWLMRFLVTYIIIYACNS